MLLYNMERLLCHNCNKKFFKNLQNNGSCPCCKTLYVRKSKKISIEEFAPSGDNEGFN